VGGFHLGKESVDWSVIVIAHCLAAPVTAERLERVIPSAFASGLAVYDFFRVIHRLKSAAESRRQVERTHNLCPCVCDAGASLVGWLSVCLSLIRSNLASAAPSFLDAAKYRSRPACGDSSFKFDQSFDGLPSAREDGPPTALCRYFAQHLHSGRGARMDDARRK
jgi:hypothetical protein